MKKDEKLALWSERIHDFQTSGQSYKAWCQENQLPVSRLAFLRHFR
ncbi:IS66 family insertion sequence element accessory protein TnpA [Coprococcus comes]